MFSNFKITDTFMRFKKILLILIISSITVFSACNEHESSKTQTAQEASKSLQPIIIQGALPIESERMAAKLDNVNVETIGGWKFWRGTYQGYPVVISKTRMGMSNSAAATALAIERYKPIAIINQGTAGGHDPALKVYDIVLGRYSTNIGAFKTPKKALGQGSNTLDWNEAFDVLPDDESDPEPIAIRKFQGNEQLIKAAFIAKQHYTKGNVVEGTIGSTDVWNNELDRIAFFRTHYQTSVEEMEAASVAQIAYQFNVPFLGIRILSNNLTNGGDYDAGTGEACQDFVLNVASEYMKAQLAAKK